MQDCRPLTSCLAPCLVAQLNSTSIEVSVKFAFPSARLRFQKRQCFLRQHEAMAVKKWNFQQSERFTEFASLSFSTSNKVATFLHRCTNHPITYHRPHHCRERD